MTTELWEKGDHADHLGFVVEVHVRQDKQTKQVVSFSKLQDELDHKTTALMQGSYGMGEAAYALVAEALRTEAMLQMLIQISAKPKLVDQILNPEKHTEVVDRLADTTAAQVVQTLKKTCYGIAQSVVQKLHDEYKGAQKT